jgi:serine/threonine kinase PknH
MWTAPPASPYPPGPPRAGKGIPWIPIAAATAVVVLVLGALGIWMLVKPDDSASTGMAPTSETTETEPTETTRRTPRTTTPREDPESFDSKLMAVLPRGYDDGVCQPAAAPATGALATVDCGPASPTGGPISARYSLFADQETLDRHFDESVAQNSEVLQCPGSGVDSPTTWHYTQTPDKVEGRIACGTYNDNADVVWTKNADLLLADAQSDTLETLHNWWLKFG